MAEKGESGKVKRKIVKIHFFVLSLEKEKKIKIKETGKHTRGRAAQLWVGGWIERGRGEKKEKRRDAK